MGEMIDTFSNRLAEAMKIRKIKAATLSEKTGIPKSSLSEYLKGKYQAKQNGIYLLSNALNVNANWLLGYDVPMEKFSENSTLKSNEEYTPVARAIARGFDKLPPDRKKLYTELLTTMLKDEEI